MKIAVLGCGTVGSGVVDLIDELGSVYAKRCSQKSVEVKYILDLRDLKDTPYETRVIHDIDSIINDGEIDVVAEMMGGTEPAFTFCTRTDKHDCRSMPSKVHYAKKARLLWRRLKRMTLHLCSERRCAAEYRCFAISFRVCLQIKRKASAVF